MERGRVTGTRMKTTIYIPVDLRELADTIARCLGMSRSELVQAALKAYLADRESLRITEKLNRVYSVADSTMDEHLEQLQSCSLRPDSW